LTLAPAHVGLVLSPFIVLPLAGWAGSRGSRLASALAAVPAALTIYFVAMFRTVAVSGPFTASLPWAEALGLTLGFHFDGLGLLFAIVITGIGTLVVLYAATYMEGVAFRGRFHVFLFAFMGSMLGVVLSDNVIALFVFWELTGFTSYFLIGFEHERADARRAAMQALLVTGTGGLALLAAAVLLSQITGTTSVSELLARHATLVDHPLYGAIAVLVLLAAFTKSAQFPFHFWLPNAMEAPTPVSAYLHSATMVKAGVYLAARMTPILGGTTLWAGTIVIAGAITMIGGSWRAVVERDLKRILAYSTVSALGVLMLLVGIGTREAVAASLVYLLAHACYKGALFLVAGGIDHETGTRDVTRLSGLRRQMPLTALTGALAALSMAGVPLFVGFVAKEQFYDAVSGSVLLLAAAVIASALLGGAALVAGIGPFLGAPSRAADEAPVSLWLAPLVLGVLGLTLGMLPGLADAPVALAVTRVIGSPASVHLAVWHGFTPTLWLSLLTLAGTVIVFRATKVARDDQPFRGTEVPRYGLHAERLYSGTLAILDRASDVLAPMLQSASLRRYLLLVIATAVALVVAALATARGLPAPNRWTPIHVHEALVVLLVAVGAVAASQARSTMGAVLSLGAVGYGVALIYALFGAPDLAMTQFAVETLTVVIFVLVFRRHRDFSELSSTLVRSRDAIVAIGAGAVITTLVLFVAASGTSSRLSWYFAENAPVLAHGRNIVNVILVDFRGFDTMGEITVLVTVAIGVRALLSIGLERRS
jgi:multicomponent Na+:H+ antiporter subunit A